MLGRQGRAWGANGGGLQRLVHALVRPVLLGMGRQNPLVLNAEPHPPDVELREAVDAGRGEGDAVVGANGGRQAVLVKDLLKDMPSARALRRPKPPTFEEVARVQVSNRQRVAVDPVAGPENAP